MSQASKYVPRPSNVPGGRRRLNARRVKLAKKRAKTVLEHAASFPAETVAWARQLLGKEV